MFTRTASLLSAMTAAVLGLACDRNPADDVAQARKEAQEEIARIQRESDQKIAEARREAEEEIAEARREAAEERADARKDVAEERREAPGGAQERAARHEGGVPRVCAQAGSAPGAAGGRAEGAGPHRARGRAGYRRPGAAGDRDEAPPPAGRGADAWFAPVVTSAHRSFTRSARSRAIDVHAAPRQVRRSEGDVPWQREQVRRLRSRGRSTVRSATRRCGSRRGMRSRSARTAATRHSMSGRTRRHRPGGDEPSTPARGAARPERGGPP